MVNTRYKSRKDQSPDAPQHRYKHNTPLMESLLLSFTVFLSFGLLVMMGVNFAKDYFSTLHHHDPEIESWVHVHHHGQTEVTQKNEDRHFNTFRYQYKTDVPFKALLVVLDDPIQQQKWFAWNVNDKAFDRNDNKRLVQDLTRVQMKIPYLHRHNREFLLEPVRTEMVTTAREDTKGSQIQQATYQYKSVEDETIPLSCTACKRGEMEMDLILSTQDEGQSTNIEMSLYMNLHSSKIPTFMLNNLTQEWGYISIMKLVKLCHSKLGLADVPDIKMMFYNLFPLKR